MVGILCPSEFEYKTLMHAHIREQGAVLVHSGMGKVRTAYACHRLLAEHPGIRSMLLVGYAGGLTSSLKVGDIAEPSVFIEQDYCAEPFEKFPNTVHKKHGSKLLEGSIAGTVLTQDRFITDNPYKDGPLAAEHPYLLCDMESYAFAYFCEKEKMLYSSIKLISDSADANADHDFVRACRELAPKLNETVLWAVQRLKSAALEGSAGGRRG